MSEQMNAGWLSGMVDAEETLRRQEEGEVGDDLAGLPPGHPVLEAMREAELRHEERQREAEEQAQRKLRRVKRLRGREQKTARRRKREAAEQRVRLASKVVNAEIDTVMSAIENLANVLRDNEDDLGTSPHVRAKLKRLERVISASYRGFEESHVSELRLLGGQENG